MPKEGLKSVIYYCLILRSLPKPMVPEKDFKKIVTTMMNYCYKHMNSVSLQVVAFSLDFVPYLNGKLAQNYVRRLEELIVTTNPKLLVDPHPDLFLTIMASFYRFKQGKVDFWKKLASLLEDSLHQIQLQQHQVLDLMQCLMASKQHTSFFASDKLW